MIKHALISEVELYSFPSDEFSRLTQIGPVAPGKYVETKFGWGKIVFVGHGSVVVSLFGRRPDPGPQHAPEVDAEIAWRAAGADKPEPGMGMMTKVRERSWIVPQGAERW